jgi:hypothetical protein
MGKQNVSKLNRLQKELPEGLVVSAAWLKAKGYSPQLCAKYVAHGWLERITPGVYRRPSGKLVWEQAIISLQTLMSFPVLVGGKTALTLQGFAHYVAREETDVHLYGRKQAPAWLAKLPLPVRFHHHSTTTLFRNEPITLGLDSVAWNLKESRSLSSESQGDSTSLAWGQWDWPLTLSTPERAIFELLDGLPYYESFEQADKFMEGLANLRPRRLQKLLADCKSIKVKRLFLFFADRHQHAWLKHLDKSKIDLGTGKRMLGRGGKLDPHYLITVPEEFHGGR